MRYLTRAISLILLFVLAEAVALHYQPIDKTTEVRVFDPSKITEPFSILVSNNGSIEIHEITNNAELMAAQHAVLPTEIPIADCKRLYVYCKVTTDDEGNRLFALYLFRGAKIFYYSICHNRLSPMYQESFAPNPMAAFLTLGIFVVLTGLSYLFLRVEIRSFSKA